MQDLTMSSEEEEYTESSDEEEEYDEFGFEEILNVSTEPPPPLPEYYGPRDFRQLTQPDGNGHLSTSVATTSARVGFKCRSILAKLREIYLRLIKAQHLHDEGRITYLTTNLRRAEGRLSQLNEYLDGQGIEVEWEDDEGEAGTFQAGTSHGRGSRGRTSE
ncbi:hypothetical protein GIB67_037331, partial [Kingdonia uniflora]